MTFNKWGKIMIDIDELKNRNSEINKNVSFALKKSGRDADSVKIIAVSKTHPTEYVVNAIKAGITVFGENYAQELRDKHQDLENLGVAQPEWHFIGHLQNNKVKYIAPFVDYIHSVDSLKLADEINKQAQKNNRKIKIMLQLNTSGELSKSGCEPDEALQIATEIIKLENIDLQGLMTIGSFTDDENQQRKEFTILRNSLIEINEKLILNLKELSMGMSHDYMTAIEEGATMVRIGTAFFGNRIYNV